MPTDTDREIAQAIEIGKKNQRTAELIRNWCSHARGTKWSGAGVGLIEAHTGLPIGHMVMECDHASAGGIAAWDLAAAAVDFHDRNCVGCAHRDPVRLPNISELVQVRDEARARSAAAARQLEEKAAEALKRRQGERQALKARIDAMAGTFADLIDELDRDRSPATREKLIGAVRLAPDHFTPELVEYVFHLIESREEWMNEAGLTLLREHGVDRARLTRCAMLSLSNHSAVETSADIVEQNLASVDDSQIAGAFVALTNLAHPPELDVMLGAPRRWIPQPLVKLHRARRKPVEAALGFYLEKKRPSEVSVAARALQALVNGDKQLAETFARPLAAKLARAKHLLEPEPGRSDDKVLREIEAATAAAFEADPTTVDVALMSFLNEAHGEDRVRLYSVYRRVLRDGRHGRRFEEKRGTPTAAQRAAFGRLIWAPTKPEEDQALQEISHAFAHGADDLRVLAAGELEALLGAALVMDDRLREFDQGEKPAPDLLSQIEHRNRRDCLSNLQESFVGWAAEGAALSPTGSRKLIELYEALPEDRDGVRYAVVKHRHKLVASPDRLNIVLPGIYSAMVGPSALLRAAAAETIGELWHARTEDLPMLLFETFAVLLRDPFVIVHKTALRALDRFNLPSELDADACAAVFALLAAYANKNDRADDEFVLRCMRIYLGRYVPPGSLKGAPGRALVAVLARMRPFEVARELRWISDHLREADGYVALLLRLAADHDAVEFERDEIIEALAALPGADVLTHKDEIEKTALGTIKDHLWLDGAFIETCTRGGAWGEAVHIADALHDSIPDNNRMRPGRLRANLRRIAARYEAAIAAGNLSLLEELGAEWRVTVAAIKDDETRNATRRNPLLGLFGKN